MISKEVTVALIQMKTILSRKTRLRLLIKETPNVPNMPKNLNRSKILRTMVGKITISAHALMCHVQFSSSFTLLPLHILPYIASRKEICKSLLLLLMVIITSVEKLTMSNSLLFISKRSTPSKWKISLITLFVSLNAQKKVIQN